MSAARLRFTLDTNILVYSVDGTAGVRHELAEEIVDRAAKQDCLLALQSISEFYAVITRKRVVPPHRAAGLVIDWIEAFATITVTEAAIRAALAHTLARRGSYWDSLLAATAAEAGCAIVLTEDMADGAALGGIRIHNPFAAAGGLTETTRRLLGG